MKFLLPLLLLTVIGQQGPVPDRSQDPPRHDKYQDDPDAYCMAGPPLPNQAAHGHECHCRLMCSPRLDDPDASPNRLEDSSCELYCTSSRCLCHADQSCDDAMDMTVPGDAPPASEPR